MRTIKEKLEKPERLEKPEKLELETRDIRLETRDIKLEKPEKDIKGNKEQKKKSSGIVESFTGKNVSIMLRDGNKLKGKLESVAQYEMVVTISYKPVIVMKHAVNYIELADEK